MPFDLTWEAHGVHRRYRGAVTIAERERSFDLICGDPRFDGLHYALTDYLEVSDYEVSETATEEIAARHIAPMQINPRIVIAAVAVDPRIHQPRPSTPGEVARFPAGDITPPQPAVLIGIDRARE